MNELQAVTELILWCEVFSYGLISPLIGRDAMNIPKIILRVHHGFSSRTVKGYFLIITQVDQFRFCS